MINWAANDVCQNHHKLQWVKKHIQKCGQCGPVDTMSRYGCTQCNIYYCVKCRQPPVMGDFCGGGHELKYVPNLKYHSCDVCRSSISGGAYRCQECDYDVCEKCWIVKED
ncbi:unnamed protein product [Paramecium sonneborni]|uniref:DC1 domain-containing protein n=1 Tax=Paramecium sonneborni TaxID=65129 RepID=A0A8S1QX23_9CILI|nr:unnamed protein product [Paramecium sonneborni]CAD8119337.1 unnamed protein product [Paramecium sonneborni]